MKSILTAPPAVEPVTLAEAKALEVPEAWRKKHGFTQEMLRLALQVGSRQTIISWEKSTKRLPRYVHLALIGLEHLDHACRRLRPRARAR